MEISASVTEGRKTWRVHCLSCCSESPEGLMSNNKMSTKQITTRGMVKGMTRMMKMMMQIWKITRYHHHQMMTKMMTWMVILYYHPYCFCCCSFYCLCDHCASRAASVAASPSRPPWARTTRRPSWWPNGASWSCSSASWLASHKPVVEQRWNTLQKLCFHMCVSVQGVSNPLVPGPFPTSGPMSFPKRPHLLVPGPSQVLVPCSFQGDPTFWSQVPFQPLIPCPFQGSTPFLSQAGTRVCTPSPTGTGCPASLWEWLCCRQYTSCGFPHEDLLV